MAEDKKDTLGLKNGLDLAFLAADDLVTKRYVSRIGDMPIVKLSSDKYKTPISGIVEGKNIQLFRIQKIVYDKNENNLDKLTTVFNSLSAYNNASIVGLIIGKKDSTSIYLGSATRNLEKKPDDEGCYQGDYIGVNVDRNKFCGTLKESFESNFAGSETMLISLTEFPKGKPNHKNNNKAIIDNAFSGKNAVSVITGIPSLKNEKVYDNEKYVQGIEKFIDSMQGKEYSVIFIADIINKDRIEELCKQYEDLYTQLYQYLQTNISFTKSEQDSTSVIKGTTDSINNSVTNSHTFSHSEGTFSSDTVGGSAGVTFGTEFFKRTLSVDYHHTKGRSNTDTTSYGRSETNGTTKSTSEQNSIAKSISEGKTVQYAYFDRHVKNMLDRIDEQIKRFRSIEDVGAFDMCTYVLANNSEISNSAAAKLQSLTRGENSSIESSVIATWSNDYEVDGIKDADMVFEYLKKFYHPVFACQYADNGEVIKTIPITPSAVISGKELAIQMALPKKSIDGIPVLESAEFGRNVSSFDAKYQGNIDIGNIYHMHKVYKNKCVKLNKNSLASHTFITGSTGAGKTNSVCQLLYNAKYEEFKFLVIEPAKGEYKSLLGGREGVHVYGTNPKITDLLKIDPFSFPENILVSEHIDRLVEIFNVCWPMYAAMPAVLKDAVIRAYEKAGWDINTSYNALSIFPTFKDVVREINAVLLESEYSDENKSNYVGALVTRLKSLTNGINGQIFVPDEISDYKLFDENVIVDLSRVGSAETKSMIMGLLILKLQEYRMARSSPNNATLKHITVLEEAHNILRRTPTEQASESSNLMGKSVEMLSNAIAEMRSFGEGFIIADQSPGLLDMSVIRNTNTKIIHRLPDYSDRELVGKAAALNDDQIIELSKLPRGVAAIYQNDWVSPVLCKISEFANKSSYIKKKSKEDNYEQQLAAKIIKNPQGLNIDHIDIEKIIRSRFSARIKKCIFYPNRMNLLDKAEMAFEAFGCDMIEKMFNDDNSFDKEGSEENERKICQLLQIKEDDVENQNLAREILYLIVLNKDREKFNEIMRFMEEMPK